MNTYTIIERQIWLGISLALGLILLAHLTVHLSIKWSDKRNRAIWKADPIKAKIIKGDAKSWCSLYIGKTIVVKPFYNNQGELVDSLFTVIPCRDNKRVLNETEWLSTKYPNAWGITLSVRKENVETTPTE